MNKLKMGMLFLLLLAVLCGTMTVSAAEAPYETYVFAYDSSVQITPNAYLPAEKIAAFGETLLKNPSDMVVDEERGLIAIADTGNNRIVLLNRNFEVTGTIGPFALPNGTEDTFDSPSGVFITEEDWLVVADTNHGRLVVFDKDNRYLRTIDGPPAQVLPENFKYNPISVAVNAAGQFYVVSKNSNMGVMALDGDGGFQGFIGAQRVASNAAQLLWRAFMTEEQLARSVQFVPVEYSSLTIDHKGFVYVTCSSIDRFELYNTIHSRSMDSTYAPVKKINPAGTDVLRRNGFFPPAGDINFSPYDGDEAVGPSQISKVILLDNGMYMLLDSYGNKLFTYDSSGNLLFAFGGKGEALGLFSRLSAAAAWGDELLALDAETGAITVFRKTAYGTLLDEVIGYQENREYDKAQGLWNELLGENNNFDLAYLGVGKALMEKGDLTGAMKYFELINNKLYYSKAYGLYRQEILQRWGLWILLGVLILILLAVWVFRKIAVHNQKTLASPAGGRLRAGLLCDFSSVQRLLGAQGGKTGRCAFRHHPAGAGLSDTGDSGGGLRVPERRRRGLGGLRRAESAGAAASMVHCQHLLHLTHGRQGLLPRRVRGGGHLDPPGHAAGAALYGGEPFPDSRGASDPGHGHQCGVYLDGGADFLFHDHGA